MQRTLVKCEGEMSASITFPSSAMAAVELDPAKLRQELAELAEKRGEVITT